MNVGRWILLAAALTPLGCFAPSQQRYEPRTAKDRSPLEAEQRTQEAMTWIEEDPGKAESLLREALTLDLYHGPAHNNLGVLCLLRGDLYEAAQEFEWARKLMPGHPDPRMNLALTLEQAGHVEEALRTYETALEVYPEHIPTMQAYSSLAVRSNQASARTREMVRLISLRGESKHWRQWAQEQLLRFETSSSNQFPSRQTAEDDGLISRE